MKNISKNELFSSFRLMELIDEENDNVSRQVLINLVGFKVKAEKKSSIDDGFKLYGREERCQKD
ncbi:MAG: hypothetical protein MJE63_17620 [Proteobacteria bacterium]|nr:hypothetical protein [Pseudomonadota bacterium]